MRLKGSNATKKLQHYNESAGKKRRLGSYSNRKVKAKVPCIMVYMPTYKGLNLTMQ